MSIIMFYEGVLLVGAQMPSANPITTFIVTKFIVTQIVAKFISRADIR